MCVTIRNSILTNTFIGVWDIDHPEYGYRHVTAYQNRVKSEVNKPNCMLLHIPSAEPLTPHCLMDTSEDQDFLTRMWDEIHPPPVDDGMAWMSGSTSRVNYVVEMGVYHIALLNELSDIAITKTMSQIPLHKRPEIAKDFLSFYQQQFPDFPLVLCCFDNQKAQMASPVMVHFKPLFPDRLMAPTLDSHGDIPEIGAEIRYHQCIVFGTRKSPANRHHYHLNLPDKFTNKLDEFMPVSFSAMELDGSTTGPNLDVIFNLAPLEEGKYPKVCFGLLGREETYRKTTINPAPYSYPQIRNLKWRSKKKKLFLDDVRNIEFIYSHQEATAFDLVRSYDQFVEYIEHNGLPDFISFDNDLGLDEREVLAPDGYACAKWLVYESGLDLSKLEFAVHSANPVATEQIRGLLNNYIRHLNTDETT